MMATVHWTWQACLCLSLLLLAWLLYLLCIARYWSLRHEPFFAIRTPWLAVFASTSNLLCVTCLLLQAIVESLSWSAANHGEDPATLPHYPCLLMLLPSLYIYPVQLGGGILRTVVAVVRWDPKFRTASLIRYVHLRGQLRVLAVLALGGLCVAGVLIGAFPRYRDDLSGLQCHYQQEWYLYLVLGPVLILAVRKVSSGIRDVDDVFSCGQELRRINHFGAVAQLYYVVNIVFDALSWSGSSVSRAELELAGLPFDLFSAALHCLYFYISIVAPQVQHRQYQQRYDVEKSSRHSAVSLTRDGHGAFHEHAPSSTRWTMLRALRDPGCAPLLKRHAQRLMCGEYIAFFEDCEAQQQAVLDKAAASEREAMETSFSRSVYDKYVALNAPFAVNVSDALRRAYRVAIDRSPQPLSPSPREGSSPPPAAVTVGQSVTVGVEPQPSPSLRSPLSSPSPLHGSISLRSSSWTSPETPQPNRSPLSSHAVSDIPSVRTAASVSVGLQLPLVSASGAGPRNPFGVRSSSSIVPYPTRQAGSRSVSARPPSSSVSSVGCAEGVWRVERSELLELFDQLYREVMQLLETNIWADFRRSDAYKEFVQLYTLKTP